VVRGEHDADAGQHAVERAVRPRQRLGVGRLPGDRQALLLGEASADVEQLRREVGRGDPRACGGRR
jgi:hypothetical protein